MFRVCLLAAQENTFEEITHLHTCTSTCNPGTMNFTVLVRTSVLVNSMYSIWLFQFQESKRRLLKEIVTHFHYAKPHPSRQNLDIGAINSMTFGREFSDCYSVPSVGCLMSRRPALYDSIYNFGRGISLH